MAIIPGDKAPVFTLYADDKRQVQLSDFSGKKVVLMFFPLAFSGTCTRQLRGLRDDAQVYADLGTEVLGISIDTVYVLAKFKKANRLNVTLLSDFNKDVSRAYGTLYEEFSFGMRGVSKRAVFVVDKKGIVRHAEILENASLLPDFEAVKTTLSRLK